MGNLIPKYRMPNGSINILKAFLTVGALSVGGLASATTSFELPFDEDTTNFKDCAGCHPRQYQEWVGSSHAYATVSPTFNALESVGNTPAIDAQGTIDSQHPGTGAFSAHSGAPTELFCQACHTPAAVQLDKNKPISILPSFASDARPTVSILEQTILADDDGSYTANEFHFDAVNDIVGLIQSGEDWESAVDDHMKDVEVALQGNSCDVCHQAIGPEHTKMDSSAFFYDSADGFGGIANASFSFASLAGLDDPKFGPFTNLFNDGHDTCQAPNYPTDPHTPVPQDCITNGFGGEKGGYISDAKFCGSCHDVRPPAGANSAMTDQNAGFLRLENLFTEWKNSPWGPGTPPPPHFNTETTQEVICQDCHMSTYPYGGVIGEHPLTKLYPVDKVSILSGAPRKVSSHYFTGVDISLLDADEFAEKPAPTGDIYDSQATLARKPYTTHTTKYINNQADEQSYSQWFKYIYMPVGQDQRRKDLLQHAVRLDVSHDTRWLNEGRIDFDVTLENVGAGHNVPSGFSQERQFWVGIEVKDASGQIIYESGFLDGSLKELKKLPRITLDARNLEIDSATLNRVGAGHLASADQLSYEDFEEYFFETDKTPNEKRDKALKFYGNEFKRRPAPSEDGVEVFSPFLANEMDNSHSLAPFSPDTFTYKVEGLSSGSLNFPLSVTTTVNFRAFPPRFLKGLIDAMDLRGHEDLLPDELLERNKVIEMARHELTITADNSPYYAMISANGRCMDIPTSDYNAGGSGTVHLWDCHSGANQDVRMLLNGQIQFRNNTCLSVKQNDWNALNQPNSVSSNLRVGVESCHSSTPRQIWQMHTNGRLKVLKQFAGEQEPREYCLQRTPFSNGGAGQLTLDECWDAVRHGGWGTRYTQQWFYEPSFRPIVSGTSTASVERCIDIDSGGIYNNASKIQLWQCNGQRQQQWRISEKGLLINAAGKCIEVAGGDLNNLNEDAVIPLGGGNTRLAKVQTWSCHEGDSPSNIGPNQRWKLEAGSLRTGINDDGRYYCLGTIGANTANGTELSLYRCDDHHISDGLDTNSSFDTLLWKQ